VKLSRKSLNKVIGNIGEDAAEKFLRKNGYRILQRNYRCRAGEIDIICEHRSVIVFVEVKTRSPRAYLPPEYAVDDAKQDQIRKAAKFYLSGFRAPSPVRYDIVSVLLNEQDEITHIELIADAFA
jgi:putative endonuclease